MTAITIPIHVQLTPETQSFLAALQSLGNTTHGQTVASHKSAQDPIITPPSHGEYWSGQGGHYICTLPALLGLPARHLIAGPECNKQLTFGPYAEVEGATSHIDGRTNTATLLAHQDDKPHQAARWASTCTADGHTDFFLPAKLDLVMAHICASHLFNPSGWYWSSTQGSRINAFVQDFEYGGSGWDGKDDQHRVRAFRWIPLELLTA